MPFPLAYNLITNKEINFYKNWCSRFHVKRNLVQNFTKADFERMPIPHQKHLLAECGGLNTEVYNYLGQEQLIIHNYILNTHNNNVNYLLNIVPEISLDEQFLHSTSLVRVLTEVLPQGTQYFPSLVATSPGLQFIQMGFSSLLHLDLWLNLVQTQLCSKT